MSKVTIDEKVKILLGLKPDDEINGNFFASYCQSPDLFQQVNAHMMVFPVLTAAQMMDQCQDDGIRDRLIVAASQMYTVSQYVSAIALAIQSETEGLLNDVIALSLTKIALTTQANVYDLLHDDSLKKSIEDDDHKTVLDFFRKVCNETLGKDDLPQVAIDALEVIGDGGMLLGEDVTEYESDNE